MHVGYGIVKFLQPQEKMRMSFGRKKFLVLTQHRDEGHYMSHRAIGEDISVHREAEGQGAMESIVQSLYWGLHRKGKTGQIKHCRTG